MKKKELPKLGCHCDMTAGIALFSSDHGWGGADSSEPRPALTFCGISRGACALMFTLGVSELTWELVHDFCSIVEDERGSPGLEAGESLIR